MKKIEIFVGSDSAFEKIVPKSARNLSEMAAKLDDGNKKMDVFVNIPGQPEPKLKKKKKYAVKVRAYTVSGGKNVYGMRSKAKKVKIKK